MKGIFCLYDDQEVICCLILEDYWGFSTEQKPFVGSSSARPLHEKKRCHRDSLSFPGTSFPFPLTPLSIRPIRMNSIKIGLPSRP